MLSPRDHSTTHASTKQVKKPNINADRLKQGEMEANLKKKLKHQLNEYYHSQLEKANKMSQQMIEQIQKDQKVKTWKMEMVYQSLDNTLKHL